MSITTALTALQQAKTDIAAAIQARGGSVQGGFSGYAAAIAAIPGDKAPNYEAAILSDVHVGAYGAASDSACRTKWQRALHWTHGWAGFTVVCGDTTYNGSTAEFQSYAALRDHHRAAPVHTITGNHDTKGGAAARDAIVSALQTTETALGATAQGSMGWTFRQGEDLYIGLHEYSEAAEGLFVPGALDWLQTVLEENRNRRCFLFFHVFDDADDIAGNASGQYNAATDIWTESSTECRRFTAMLRHYRNVIWFHGHTHTTFAYQYIGGVWQDKANIDTHNSIRNVHISSVGYPRAKAGESYTWLNGESQGYRMAVYDTYIRLQAVDLVTGATLYSYAIDTTPYAVAAGTYADPPATPDDPTDAYDAVTDIGALVWYDYVTASSSGGTLSDSSSHAITNLVRLNGNTSLRVTTHDYPGGRVHYYDAQKNWLSCSDALYNAGARSVAVPAGAAYFRLRGYYNDHYGVAFPEGDSGSAATTYTDTTDAARCAWFDGYSPKTDTGVWRAKAGDASTNYITVGTATTVTVTVEAVPGGCVHFYDASFTWLGHDDGTGLSTNGTKNMLAGTHAIVIPASAAYLVVTGYSAAGGHYAFTLA